MRIPSEDLQNRIMDTIRYRFYDRLDLYDVYRWLDNFEDEEQELAVSVFERLEYYREEDLLGILNKELEHVVTDIFNECNKALHLSFIPLGAPGKSGHVIQYLVKNLLKNKKLTHTKGVSFYNHPKEIDIVNLSEEDIVIFLDDIIGSGNTFTNAVNANVVKYNKDGVKKEVPNMYTIGNIVKADAPYKIVLLSCILMDKGKANLEKEIPFVKLYGEVRLHAFHKNKSPFGGYLRMKQIREFCYKYGSKICKGSELGYSNSQALILFAHAIPNNTLPIVWVDKNIKEHAKISWQPLIPRNQMKKQNMAFIQRMNNNRWVFKLSQYFGVEPSTPKWKGVIQDKNVKLTYLLRCLEKKIPEVVIANDMGLTNEDMTILFEDGIKLGMWDNAHHVTRDAQKALVEAAKVFKIQNKNKKGVNIVDDRNYMYVPETFKEKS